MFGWGPPPLQGWSGGRVGKLVVPVLPCHMLLGVRGMCYRRLGYETLVNEAARKSGFLAGFQLRWHSSGTLTDTAVVVSGPVHTCSYDRASSIAGFSWR
jgi:hypothetical protein